MQNKKWITNILLIFFLGVFCFSLYHVYHLVKDHHSNKKEVEQIQDEIIENVKQPKESKESTEEETSNKEELELNFDKLYQINSDTVGWIEIKNTNINFPIVQTTNNDYYLNHSFYKVENGDGWIFMNYMNTSNYKDPNTIIFGHDTHGSYMFSDLKKLHDGLLGNYIPIIIYTKEGNHHYETFSIFLVEENDNEFLNQVLTKEEIEKAKNKSKYDFGVQVEETDKILTLSTCYHTSKNKVILLARKID